MRSAVLIACALAACGRADPARPMPVPAVSSVASPAPRSSPTASSIVAVAATETGDAALTIDAIGELRLWPSLDGTRPPVPVAAAAPTTIALAHAGGDLLAAVVDNAGNAQLLVLGRDGSVRRRAQLPAEAAIDQVVALDDGVLVHRADHAIERYDANATRIARLEPPPGQLVGALAVRRGSAFALVGENLARVEAVRELVLARGLAWGPPVRLPHAVRGDVLALAPSHQRIAAIDDNAAMLAIYDLSPSPHPFRDAARPVPPNARLGFVDNDTLAIVVPEGHVMWWTGQPPSDLWDVEASQARIDARALTMAAIVDRVALIGIGASLALAGPTRTRFLGWGQLAQGRLASTGGQLWFEHDREIRWLDDSLAVLHERDLDDLQVSAGLGFPVGPHHVLTASTIDQGQVVELHELDHPVSQCSVLGLMTEVRVVAFDPDHREVAIARWQSNEIMRWRIDLEHTRAIPLTPLRAGGEVTGLWLLDPERAGGTLAVARVERGEREELETFAVPGPRDAVGKARPLRPLDRSILAVDASGTIYASGANNRLRPAGSRRAEGQRLFAMAPRVAASRGAEAERPFAVLSDIQAVAPSHDTTHVAVAGEQAVQLFDAGGTLRWRRPLWAVNGLVFSADDRRLIASSDVGLIVMDTATGAPIGAICGWSFGLHDSPPGAQVFDQRTACEDLTSP
jgi:hypothetical protein